MTDASPPAPAEVPLWNAANVLTGLRVLLVPVFIATLFAGGGHDARWRWIATAVFAIASITDRYDGKIARERGLVTDFGKIADPIADKALTGAALIGLALLGDVAWWIAIVILVREVGITLLRFAVIRRGVIAASAGGKVKTVLLVAAIMLYLQPLWFGLPVLSWIALAALIAALIVCVLTGVDYLVKALRPRVAK